MICKKRFRGFDFYPATRFEPGTAGCEAGKPPLSYAAKFSIVDKILGRKIGLQSPSINQL